MNIRKTIRAVTSTGLLLFGVSLALNSYELNLATAGGDTPPPPTCLGMSNLPYPADRDYFSGPASVQMALNTCPTTANRICIGQTTIYGVIQTYNTEVSLGWYCDPKGMEAALEETVVYSTDGTWSDYSNTNKNDALVSMLYWMDRKQYLAMASIGSYEHWVAVAGFSIAGTSSPPSSGTVNLQWLCFHDPLASNPSSCVVSGNTWLTDTAYWGVSHNRPGSAWDGKYITIVEPPPVNVRIITQRPLRRGRILTPEAAGRKLLAWLAKMKETKGCTSCILRLDQLKEFRMKRPVLVSAQKYGYYLISAEHPSRLVAVVNAYDGSVEEIRYFEREQRYIVDPGDIRSILKETFAQYKVKLIKTSRPRLVYRPELTQLGRCSPTWEVQAVVRDAKDRKLQLPISLNPAGQIISGMKKFKEVRIKREALIPKR